MILGLKKSEDLSHIFCNDFQTFLGAQMFCEADVQCDIHIFSQVDIAAQIPWYERLSEFKMPWEMHSNKQTVIKDLNLRVHSGQMLAVIGSSGMSNFLCAELNKKHFKWIKVARKSEGN